MGPAFDAAAASTPMTLEPHLLEGLLQQAGAPYDDWQAAQCQTVALRVGGNNRIWRIQHESGECVLKAYFRHPSDSRDRLGTEYRFLHHLWAQGIRDIPRPLACDPAHGVALYSLVPGQVVADPAMISGEDVAAAASFLHRINSAACRGAGQSLAPASEACFRVSDHLATMRRRVQRLELLAPRPSQQAAAEDLLRRIRACVHTVESAVGEGVSANGPAADERLSMARRCLSPSDFGFHNALRDETGHWHFVDFEYAGWDDPAKTVSDFFAHPGVPVARQHAALFWQLFGQTFEERDRAYLASRARLLAPVLRLKWVCIVLNELLPQAARRREFAGALPDDEVAQRQQRQIAKAHGLLDTLLEPLEI